MKDKLYTFVWTYNGEEYVTIEVHIKKGIVSFPYFMFNGKIYKKVVEELGECGYILPSLDYSIYEFYSWKSEIPQYAGLPGIEVKETVKDID